MAAPEMPQRFPCWVKAVYSWGGEGKRDLGFIEGDLIECLNAGDGSWWMGRLRRDKRMVGLFPSNFVKVLDESFQPAPRPASSSTPIKTSGSGSTPGSPQTSTPTTASPQKSKSLFRMPFTAYASAGAPNPLAAAREMEKNSPKATPSPAGSVSKSSMRLPYASMKKRHDASPSPSPAPNRPPSPVIPAPLPRGISPKPSVDMHRPLSPVAAPLRSRFDTEDLVQQSRASSVRAQSPQYGTRSQPSFASFHEADDYGTAQSTFARVTSPHSYDHYSRPASPAPPHIPEDSSPGPPPPPAHRVPYVRHDPPPQLPQHHDFSDQHFHSTQPYTPSYDTPRTHSPAPPEHMYGSSPTPVREAIQDVTSSLGDMSLSEDYSHAPSHSPPNIWSPDAFDEIYSAALKENKRKPPPVSRYTEEPEVEFARVQTVHRQSASAAPVTMDPWPSDYLQQQQHDQEPYQTEDNGLRELYDLNGQEYAPRNSQYKTSGGAQYNRASQYDDIENAQHFRTQSDMQFSPDVSRSSTSASQLRLRAHRSAYELGRPKMNRTMTASSSVTTASSAAHSSTTNNSNFTQMTSQSLMSGHSAGGFSATSAGSLARRKWTRNGSIKSLSRPASAMEIIRPGTALSTISAHSSLASGHELQATVGCQPIEPDVPDRSSSPLKKKRSGFFRRVLDTAKTGTATVRSTVSSPQSSRPQSSYHSAIPKGVTSIAGGLAVSSAASDMGLGDGSEWVRMRRDVNRSNSLSRNERNERVERCQILDTVVMKPVDVLLEAEGDENEYGEPVREPSDFSVCNHTLVDKNARFVNNLPALVNPTSLAQGYLCRPYRVNVQRLRAIFTWVAERITWEEDYDGDIDTRRVIQTGRGCSEEIALLVAEMCGAVGIHADVVRGYLKSPGETVRHNLSEIAARPNHWWNTVLIDGEWRMMDCALASPSHPKRCAYSATGAQIADPWWFLARPTEICYTHVPLLPEQQHIVSPLPHDILMALPVASPACFKCRIRLWDFDTSLLHLDGLEMAHVHLVVPDDVDCVAEVEARAFARDGDGDYFESGDVVKQRVLAQGEYVTCGGTTFKRYTIKAVPPASSGSVSCSNQSILKIYAGHRGLMHSINNNPYPLALSLPLTHLGENPPYEFFTRHPTPHALRHELYVTGPLCKRLVHNSTFVFGVRQHPASTTDAPPSLARHLSDQSSISGCPSRPTSTLNRANSALSIASISVSGSAYSNPSETGSDPSQQSDKPAKLAIQSPSGKIMKMTRKVVGNQSRLDAQQQDDGTVRIGSLWETIVKIGERGTWRGLVLADRTARWCVFAEWECV